MYSVDPEKLYVATYKEIIIIFITFIIILIILYPKNLLEKQVLLEADNYDLSMLYLQNMVDHDPKNEKLMFNLAKHSLSGNKRDLAYRLLQLLKNSKNKTIKSKSYQLSYQIAKEDYFYLLEDHKTKDAQKLYKDLKNLYKHIVNEQMYSNDDLEKLYKEALFLKDTHAIYMFTQKLITKEPNNIKYLKNGYYLAFKYKNYKKALSYLDKLIMLDTKQNQEWKEAKYFILYNHISLQEAKKFLIQEATISKIWLEKLASFYLANKNYKEASQVYMTLFKNATNDTQKFHFWIKAMDILRAGNDMQGASDLGAKYQNEFFHNKEARIYLLKLYIAANDQKRANLLARKILQVRKQK